MYEISERGDVRRVGRSSRAQVGKILKWKPRHDGYWQVNLSRDSIVRSAKIHKLVAEAFLGACPDGHDVDHKNSNKFDNHWKNLEYVTHGENMTRAYRGGLLQGRDTQTGKFVSRA